MEIHFVFFYLKKNNIAPIWSLIFDFNWSIMSWHFPTPTYTLVCDDSVFCAGRSQMIFTICNMNEPKYGGQLRRQKAVKVKMLAALYVGQSNGNIFSAGEWKREFNLHWAPLRFVPNRFSIWIRLYLCPVSASVYILQYRWIKNSCMLEWLMATKTNPKKWMVCSPIASTFW